MLPFETYLYDLLRARQESVVDLYYFKTFLNRIWRSPDGVPQSLVAFYMRDRYMTEEPVHF